MIILLAIAIFLLIYAKFQYKISIDWASILQPTIPLDMGVFGVYCFTGKQGSGKTYALTKYVKKHVDEATKIYSNMTIKGIEYTELKSIEHLLSLRDEKNVFIIYDEILNLLNDKTIPRDIRDELYEFLTQQRKMKNILFTTSQEWLNIPIEFRRFVRIQIECETMPLGFLGGILKEYYYNAYKMKWEPLENEYVAPLISSKLSKYEKRFMQSYDTYERVRKLARR